MTWLEITVETHPESIADAAQALTAAGFSDLVMEDHVEFETFLEENRAYWDYIDEELQEKLRDRSCIKLYLEDTDREGMERLETLLSQMRSRKGAPFGELPVKTVPLPDMDWEESWKENYPPQPVGQKLLVLPYWLADIDLAGRLPVILDPGLTFGTGAHPSTQMVLGAMEQLLPQGGSCVDLGSGSGILSIAALRLGACAAIGVDIDPKAEDIARENAAYNGFHAPAFTALTGDVTREEGLMNRLRSRSYDLVLVNIVADVIIRLAPVLPELMDAHSVLICSGILDTRLPEVIEALEQAGLTITQTHAQEDWRCVCAKRSNP